MDPSQRPGAKRRPPPHAAMPIPGPPPEGKPTPHVHGVIHHCMPVAGSAVGNVTHPVAPAAPHASLAASLPRCKGGSRPPPTNVLHTYPISTATAPEEEAEQSPPLVQPASQPSKAATTESMELAVVPFVGSTHGPSSHSSDTARTNVDETGGGHNNGGLCPAGPAGYGELAPVVLSTERVCPHCLRPYDYYDDNPFEDMYDPTNAFYRPGETAANTTRQLPPPPALTAPYTPQQEQQLLCTRSSASTTVVSANALAAGASGAVREAGGTPPSVSSTRSPRSAHKASAAGGGGGVASGGPAFSPPAVAFTAHYFRALPPPTAIIAAMAMGTVPLAIEDYHSPDLRGNNEEDTPMYAAVVAGGQQGRVLSGQSGALVPARATSACYPSGSPPARQKTALPLKLMQSEEGDASEQVSLPGDEEREAALDLADDPTQNDRESLSTSYMYSPNAPGPAPNNGYYKHYFRELCQLGRGTYGGVYLCRHLMCGVNLGDFALKKIPVGDKAGYLQSVLREVRILEEVRRHPNVVEYKHSWVEDAQLADFGPPVRCLFILMEYASGGSLDAYLEKYGTHLSTLAVWYFFLSAVAGTAHLHQKHILHRDLKPQNLLLAEMRGRPPRVLVSDFGTAAILGDISYERSGGTGTLEYMAPELFEMAASPHGASERYVNRHTFASDVWSLGIILYFLAFDATLPDRREDGSMVLDTPRLASYGRPPEMMKLLKAMLQLDSAKRPRCSDILCSPYVQSILRMFSQEDMTQWDLLAQQQEQTRRGNAAKTPAPPLASLSPRQAQAVAPVGKSSMERKEGGANALENRHHITVTSTTSPAMQLRLDRQLESNDSPIFGNENLCNSRVVELQSTMTLLDLGSPRPANAVPPADEQQQHLQPLPSHGRGRPARRLSFMKGQREELRHGRGSFSHQLQSFMAGSISSTVVSPPPSKVDDGVQTDPVKIVDA
ncbi:putative protein kinase [Leptomonas seymouri]|uniref:non-specific serine/threonine protein kinase n=1 Tax=Leptomonas seymouri TaxID=5684 RepID=A0A0N1I119_LEPSE|nr:putative protein kinase [Leptomonas seymouri]|eukprot:KPI82872.1 putative protein kinase [Leptomonas seymouri]